MSFTTKEGVVIHDSQIRTKQIMDYRSNLPPNFVRERDKNQNLLDVYTHRYLPGVLAIPILQLSEIERFTHLLFVGPEGDLILHCISEFNGVEFPLSFPKFRIVYDDLETLGDFGHGMHMLWTDETAMKDTWYGQGSMATLWDAAISSGNFYKVKAVSANRADGLILDPDPETHVHNVSQHYIQVAKGRLERVAGMVNLNYKFLFGIATNANDGDMFASYAKTLGDHFTPDIALGSGQIVAVNTPAYAGYKVLESRCLFFTRSKLDLTTAKSLAGFELAVEGVTSKYPEDRTVATIKLEPRTWFREKARELFDQLEVGLIPLTRWITFATIDGIGGFEPIVVPGKIALPVSSAGYQYTYNDIPNTPEAIADWLNVTTKFFGLPRFIQRRFSLFESLSFNALLPYTADEATFAIEQPPVFWRDVPIYAKYFAEYNAGINNLSNQGIYFQWQATLVAASYPMVFPLIQLNSYNPYPGLSQLASPYSVTEKIQLFKSVVNDRFKIDEFISEPIDLLSVAKIGWHVGDKSICDLALFAYWLPGLRALERENRWATCGFIDSAFSLLQLNPITIVSEPEVPGTAFLDDVTTRLNAGLITMDQANAQYRTDPGLGMGVPSRSVSVFPSDDPIMRVKNIHALTQWEFAVDIIFDIASKHVEETAKSKMPF